MSHFMIHDMLETAASYSTRVAPLNHPKAQALAVSLLEQDEIFAAPTDTVYGIFCSPSSTLAISRIYIAKDRPPDKAIPVLIAEADQLNRVVAGPIMPLARRLMQELWPGALTLVLPARSHLPDILTAGQSTIAVRMPNHPGLLHLLRQTGPLAATSANRSGGPDTHTAKEVLDQLDGRLPLILSDDDAPPARSVPSTIVDLTPPAGPQILREGPLGEAVRALIAAA